MIHATNAGSLLLLDDMLSNFDEDKILHLYKNNVTIDEDTVAEDFDECEFTGYAVATLVHSNWTPAIVHDEKAVSWYSPTLTWTGSDTEMVYGYFVTDTSGSLLWGEPCFAGRIFKANDVLFLQPKISLRCGNDE